VSFSLVLFCLLTWPLRSTFDSSRFTTSERRQRARDRSIRLFIHLFIVVKLLTQFASVLRFSKFDVAGRQFVRPGLLSPNILLASFVPPAAARPKWQSRPLTSTSLLSAGAPPCKNVPGSPYFLPSLLVESLSWSATLGYQVPTLPGRGVCSAFQTHDIVTFRLEMELAAKPDVRPNPCDKLHYGSRVLH
jgi:hypothetical protein